MKNILIILILLGAGAGIFYFFNQRENREDMELVEPFQQSASSVPSLPNELDQPTTELQNTGKYIPFSQGVLEANSASRRVLFFYANWCPTCRPADSEFIEKVSQLPSDITLIRVNYNDDETEQAERDLAQKYGITYQHTFVLLDEQGSAITKWNGGSMSDLLNQLD